MEQPLQNFETQSLKSSVDLDNCCAEALVFTKDIYISIITPFAYITQNGFLKALR